MKSLRIVLLVCALFLAVGAPALTFAATAADLDGNWTGGFVHRGSWVNLSIELASAGGFAGTADVAFTDYEGEREIALTDASVDGTAVRFTIATTRGPIAFEGRVTE